MDTSNIVGLLIAALGGAAVGLERQWSGHAEGPGARVAGLRTVTILRGGGGVSESSSERSPAGSASASEWDGDGVWGRSTHGGRG